MKGACIEPDDILVVDRALTAISHSIVIVRVGKHMAIRRLQITTDGLVLLAENPSYKPVEITHCADYEIWGVVTHIVTRAR